MNGPLKGLAYFIQGEMFDALHGLVGPSPLQSCMLRNNQLVVYSSVSCSEVPVLVIHHKRKQSCKAKLPLIRNELKVIKNVNDIVLKFLMSFSTDECWSSSGTIPPYDSNSASGSPQVYISFTMCYLDSWFDSQVGSSAMCKVNSCRE